VDWKLIESEFLSRFQASVAANDYPFGVDNDGLANAKLTDRSSYSVNSVIVDTGIVEVGTNAIERPHFNLQSSGGHSAILWV
jgi:hypothetical protein